MALTDSTHAVQAAAEVAPLAVVVEFAGHPMHGAEPLLLLEYVPRSQSVTGDAETVAIVIRIARYAIEWIVRCLATIAICDIFPGIEGTRWRCSVLGSSFL